ncbi:hypothetical protein [Nostocoides sp. F2B08]|uniref:hypothetical protein n=1 Tax=Nostocoides sp. F2B08 TaxID=2653936 RepID=UPI00186ABD52|nr:hypothetical protein [Tetrasphaera sp. F2B08]
MPVSLKYAVVERERRFLVRVIPDGVVDRVVIVDRYLTGTRLRLREARTADGGVVRKLGQKVRLSDGPAEVACTNVYLDDAEWSLLVGLPSRLLRKTRHIVERDGLTVAVDEHEDGSLVAEIDAGAAEPIPTPEWLEVLADVSGDEEWTGAALARRGRP